MDVESGSHTAGVSRPLAALSDDDLLRGLSRILAQSRRLESELVAHIAEVDERRLWAREAFPSMFTYCTMALHLSESETYLRITVARVSREHPMILAMLGDGRLHLTGIALLAPHLTQENRTSLLKRATHRSKREIEELVAELAPRPDAPALMRKLSGTGAYARSGLRAERLEDLTVTMAVSPAGAGEPSAVCSLPAGVLAPERPWTDDHLAASTTAPLATDLGTPSGMGRTVTFETQPEIGRQQAAGDSLALPAQPVASHSARAVIQPLALGRYKVQFTASEELHRELLRLRALMRTQVPDGDLGVLIEIAVGEKLARLETRRFGAKSRPRRRPTDEARSQGDPPSSRHIPASVRRAVRERDRDRCAYVDAEGRRCVERDRLEYHHRRPFGLGGGHEPENVCLMCRAHNVYQAERDYGQSAMMRFRRGANVEVS